MSTSTSLGEDTMKLNCDGLYNCYEAQHKDEVFEHGVVVEARKNALMETRESSSNYGVKTRPRYIVSHGLSSFSIITRKIKVLKNRILYCFKGYLMISVHIWRFDGRIIPFPHHHDHYGNRDQTAFLHHRFHKPSTHEYEVKNPKGLFPFQAPNKSLILMMRSIPTFLVIKIGRTWLSTDLPNK